MTTKEKDMPTDRAMPRSESDVIFKYPLAVVDVQEIELPSRSEILTAQMQGDQLCVWARVNTNWPKVARRIFIYGTGHPMFNRMSQRYVGTVQMNGGALIFHVFEETP